MAFTAPKASTTARGYGSTHAKARRAAAKQHQSTDPCARCDHPLGPMGSWLHWDHNDQRDGYLGFSHGNRRCPVCGVRCNVRAGAKVGRAKQEQRRLFILDPTGNGCPTCGRALTAAEKAAGRKYCSQRCGWLAHKDDPPRQKVKRTPKPAAPPPPQRECGICGCTYVGTRKYCSDACMYEYNRQRARSRPARMRGDALRW